MRKLPCDALWESTCKFPNFASGFGIFAYVVTDSRQQNCTLPKNPLRKIKCNVAGSRFIRVLATPL